MINDLHAAWRSAKFRKSSHSGGQNGACVEIARTPDLFGVRDSKNATGPVLELTATHGHAFVSAVRSGRIGG